MQRSFISVTWTPDVDIRDAQTLGRTIEDVYGVLRPYFGRIPGQFDPMPSVRIFGAWEIQGMPDGSAYSSIDWYIQHSLTDDRERILASRYLNTVRLEPWQGTSPHFDLALTERELEDDLLTGKRPAQEGPLTHAALGFSRPGLISLVSTHPFNTLSNPRYRLLALRQTYAHYIGRLFDTPHPGNESRTVETRHGEVYCTNECALRYFETPQQALAFARQQDDASLLYCRTCQQEMAAQITSFHYGLN